MLNKLDPKDNQAWEIMRNSLEVSEQDIRFVKNIADEQRHGGDVSFSGADWKKFVQITWNVGDRFLTFLSRQIEK